jgi:hypothetical protein
VNISGRDLSAQYERARVAWPFIDAIERDHGLPALLLYAVGSRETNLRNIKGDFSRRPGESAKQFHGFGVWQRDSQHGVDESYLEDVRRQAEDAAELLQANHTSLKRWDSAIAAYNCGPGRVRKALDANRPVDFYTTGKDYSADVLSRHTQLVTSTAEPLVTTGCTTVPDKVFFAVGKNHRCFKLMGERFLVWLGDGISHDGNGYQPGPVFSTHDVKNVKKCQKLMGDDADGWFGARQWKRLLTERAP